MNKLAPLTPDTPASSLQGIIFDCDGTLADTMPLHWRAWQVIAQRHRLHFPEERFYALGGVPSRDILKLLRQEQGLSIDPLVVASEKEAENIQALKNQHPEKSQISTSKVVGE